MLVCGDHIDLARSGLIVPAVGLITALLCVPRSQGHTATHEFLVSTMEAFKREMFQEFKSHSSQMQELTKSVEFLSANIDTSNQALKKVQRIMLRLGETVNELKSKVRELEQYSRRTNLEISSIPVTRNEDTMKILRDIGTAIGVKLHDTQVMTAHRVPSYKQGRAPPMVIQFQTKMQRDVWITNYRRTRSYQPAE
ncbi:hypothetical protein J6590_066481 [Homalodisca vitripennis]|nr:hypothetical protein J6590_066481 [Homalodisca vitripennis]